MCVIQNLKEKEDKIKSLKEEKALLQKRFSTENSQINVLDALVDCTERYIIPAAIAVYEKIEETYLLISLITPSWVYGKSLVLRGWSLLVDFWTHNPTVQQAKQQVGLVW